MAADNSTSKKERLSKESLKRSLRIFKYIRPFLPQFTGAMILLVLGSMIFMLLVGLPGEMANIAIGQPKFDFGLTVRDFGWVFLIFLVVQGLMSYFRTLLFAEVSEKGMARLRKDLYENIICQPVIFFEEKRVGELSSRITADVEQLQSVFSITLAEFIRQVVILILGIVFIFIWAPKLSLIMLVTFPAIVISAVIFGRYIRQLSKSRQDKLAETNTIVDETLQSFMVVKSFANEWYETMRYGRSVDEVVDVSLKYAKMRGIFFTFIITILFGGIFFILWQGALMVQDKQMEAGDLFSFIMYTGILGGAIASFGTLYTQIAGAVGATERILEILKTTPEVTLKNSQKEEFISVTGNIEYKNVGFAYPSRPDVQVLKDINISIAAGQKIALVGQSGSGKSTIAQLLMKFYGVQQGDILIDGKNIANFEVSAFRKNISIVPQDVILYGGTIRENISYGNPLASEEDVMLAARQSNSWEFISSFPDGLDTIVGERGIKLSGGQRQRIAIARAILKNPKILILDEATSSLDAESEKLVQDALDILMKGRTSIIIAHRLSTIRDVDCIYVLDQGIIKEKGTHDELMAKDEGVFASLAKLHYELE